VGTQLWEAECLYSPIRTQVMQMEFMCGTLIYFNHLT